MATKLTCEHVWREISNYLENQTSAELRQGMERHFKECQHCSSVRDGTQNVTHLAGDARAFHLPDGFSKRLSARIDQYIATLPENGAAAASQQIAMGITEDYVPLGSHLIYFWETDQEFERGVRFLYPGLGKGEHAIAFGHDEALEKVLKTLRSGGFDPEQLIRNRELTVLRRHASAQATLSDIAAVLDSAVRAGATAVRFLGNLGMGRDPLPAGEDDVTELENQASALISRSPCVIVCMYDVSTLPGRLIVKGGLEQHRLTVCAEGVHENPYFLPELRAAGLRHIH